MTISAEAFEIANRVRSFHIGTESWWKSDTHETLASAANDLLRVGTPAKAIESALIEVLVAMRQEYGE